MRELLNLYRERGPRGTFTAIVVEPWARIDEAYRGKPCGALNPRQAAFVTFVTTCLCLTFLRFVVMDRDVQAGLASVICEVVGVFSSPGKELLYRYHRLLVNCSWVLGCAMCYFVVPAAVVRIVFQQKLSDHFLAPRGYGKHLWIYAALFTPVGLLVVIFSKSPDFLAQYPFYKDQTAWLDLLTWEVAYGIQFFCLEFFFRGFILRGFASEMGSMAVLIMTIPYCMIHFGKPLPECLGSIIAGTTLGLLAMDTRSIWGGVTIHIAVAWAMDFSALYQKGVLQTLTQ